jgi:hypothetical protein
MKKTLHWVVIGTILFAPLLLIIDFDKFIPFVLTIWMILVFYYIRVLKK